MANLTTQQIEQLWIQAGGPPDVAPLMAALALQQSSGNPGASYVTTKQTAIPGASPESSHGLWQINVESNANPEFAGENLADPLTNARAAVALYKKDGVSPWGYVVQNGKAVENPVVAAWNSAGGDKQQAATSALEAAGAPAKSINPADLSPSSLNAAGNPNGAQQFSLDQPATQPSAAPQPTTPNPGAAQLTSTPSPPGYTLPQVPEYTGPGGYKGFDLSALSPALVPEAKQAIDQYIANPNLEQQVLGDIQNNYGAESWAANNPQIRTLLVVGSVLDWAKDPNLFQSQVLRTSWWKNTSENQRAYQQLAGTDPAQAHQAFLLARARVVDTANQLGVQLSGAQVQKIATTVVQQSVTQSGVYSATTFSDQQVAQAVANEFKASTLTPSPSGPTPPENAAGMTAQQANPLNQGNAAMNAPVTSVQPGGDAADLFNQFQAIAKEYYLPLNSKQIAQQVQNYMHGYTGQGSFTTGAVQGFETYAKQMAANLYPALRNIIGTSDANGSTAQTPYSALAGYRTLIANYTGYNGDPDTINLASPQWSWILTGNSPTGTATKPTAASQSQPQSANAATSPESLAANAATASTTPKIQTTPGQLPTYDAVQKYLMQQPQYQTTDAAKTQAWQVATAILKNFGYVG